MIRRSAPIRRSAQKRSSKPIARSAIKRKPRKPSETIRIYGPPARREFVKSLPCCTCHVEGFTDQAHVAPPGEKGTGYKAGHLWIVPLCHNRLEYFPKSVRATIGCHYLYDEEHWLFVRQFPDFDPARAAADTERRWQEASR